MEGPVQQLTPVSCELCILMLADDIVLLSDTPAGLQIQLTSLHIELHVHYQLQIRMKESNIVVLRKGD